MLDREATLETSLLYSKFFIRVLGVPRNFVSASFPPHSCIVLQLVMMHFVKGRNYDNTSYFRRCSYPDKFTDTAHRGKVSAGGGNLAILLNGQ